MSKKQILINLKVKLNRLKELEISNNYQFTTLNTYAIFLNSAIAQLNLRLVDQIATLGPGSSQTASTKPSNVEIAKMNEIINKYSEAITEINPNDGISIINQFKQTSGKMKVIIFGINIALVLACGKLFYSIGVDIGNNDKNTLLKTISTKEHEINKLYMQKDSLNKIIINTQLSPTVDSLKKENPLK
jgi:hypothetical protein